MTPCTGIYNTNCTPQTPTLLPSSVSMSILLAIAVSS